MTGRTFSTVPIRRLQTFDPERFLVEEYAANEPVVFEGVTTDWGPSFQTVEGLKNAMRGLRTPVILSRTRRILYGNVDRSAWDDVEQPVAVHQELEFEFESFLERMNAELGDPSSCGLYSVSAIPRTLSDGFGSHALL